jgi:FdhE protein
MTIVGGSIRAGVEIGEVSGGEFCRPPQPAVLFALRAERFAYLANDHPMGAYLRFLADLSRAQQATVAMPGGFAAPDAAHLQRCRTHGLPPLRPLRAKGDPGWRPTLDRLLAGLATSALPDAAAAAVARLRAASDGTLAELAEGFLQNEYPADAMAETMLVGAALQVEHAKLASLLDAHQLVNVGDGLCPACGGLPVSGMVVEWPRAHGLRYLFCSVCATAWNYVRIKCVFCASTKGIGYQGIAGGDPAVKAETCDECKAYLKLIHQHRAPKADPVADDVASLALDLLVREAGWQRRASNPFLVGT